MLNDYKRFADVLAGDVLSKLEGSHYDFSRFKSINKPSRSIILGSLSDASIKRNRSKTSVKNNSLAVKFLLNELSNSFEIIPSFSVFYRVFPTFEEQKKYHAENNQDNMSQFSRVWKRKEFKCDPIILDYQKNEYEIDLGDFIKEILDDDYLFTAKETDVISNFDDEKSFVDSLDLFKSGKIPNFDWKCKIYLNKSKLEQNNSDFDLVEIGMVNMTEEDKTYETFLFDCNLEIYLEDNELIPFVYSYDKDDEKETYESKLRTLNCHAFFDPENKINTMHYAKFEDIKKEPRTYYANFTPSFERLMSEDCIMDLEELYSLMDNFEKNSTCTPSNSKDFNNFKISKSNFLKGIICLKRNEKALKAFQLMNKSFLYNSKGKYDSWRIFQIVFIVSMIPEIVCKSDPRENCDLLHVMTGGGKSETYFGVVIFNAFYDRLIGKSFGVTALTKFPLRMLSIQQLQRISSLFMWAEEIRLDEKILGEPFSVSYYVGNQDNDDFPKDNGGIIEEIKNSEEPIPGRILSKCPICGEDVVLIYDEIKSLVMHECLGCERQFGLFFTDYEIYRVLPTLVISTVDKLAAISQQRRVKNLFGGKLDSCSEGHGYISKNSKCDVKGCDGENIPLDVNFNTGPSLIIQDEMHLVKEGFGTIDSHFETLYDTLSSEFSCEHYKYIVMSATVNGASKQIKELYDKEVRIFPSTLVNNDGEEFFFKDYEENGHIVHNRQIIGLKPNNIDNNSAIILSLRYVSEFIKSVEEDDGFASKMGIDKELLKDIVDSYKSILSYHLKVSDVHNTHNYVGRNINDSNLELYRIDPMTLTGDDSLNDIKSLISTVESFPGDIDDKLQLTSATNIVSHGVDIDNWNLMFFQGIPRSTSEYIQALSRVGRKYNGLIFLWFYPNRVRDLSFYQNFKEYHRILQYKVEKVPISRWAKLGFKQTFTSIFNAAILTYLSDYLEKPIYDIREIKKVLSDEKNRQLLIDFIKKVYVSDSDALGADYFRDNIEAEVDERIDYLNKYTGANTFLAEVLADCDRKYFKTQTGMRGIQDTVNVKRDLPISFKGK